MASVAVGVLLVLAGFLVVSAAAKAIRPGPAAAALVELGLSPLAARVAVTAGVTVEAAVAGAIVVWPHALAAQAAYAALFGVFAVFGTLSLLTGRAVTCGCFGAIRGSTLGWVQLFQLALVVPSVIVVAWFAPRWSVETGLGVFLLVNVAAGGVLLALSSPTWWRIRRDRVSLGRVQAYVSQNGWPEMTISETTGGSR